jgi:uncharacterized protein involved in exopolysaccharide biosynthesis
MLLPLVGLAVGLVGGKMYETRLTILVQEPAKLNPFLADLAVGTRLNERMPVLEALARSPFVLAVALTERKLLTPDTPREERERLIRKLSASLTIELIGSDLVDLRLRGREPDELDQLLAAIGRHFIEKLVAPERSSIAGSVDFLDRQISDRRASLTATEQRLAEFKTEHTAQLPEFHAANVQQLARLRQLLAERRIELAGVTAAAADLRETLVTMNPVVGHLQEEIVRVTGEIARMRARYTEQHPSIRSAERELGRLKQEQARALAQAKELAEDAFNQLWNQAVAARQPAAQPGFIVSQLEQLQAVRARRIALEKEVAQLQGTTAELQVIVSNQDRVATELTALERDLGTEQEVYAILLKRSEMARVTGDLGSFEADQRVIVIENPDQPLSVGPSTALIVLAGAVGGLALGMGLAIAAELGDDTVRRRADLEQIPGLRLLARIPHLPPETSLSEGDLRAATPADLRTSEGRA